MMMLRAAIIGCGLIGHRRAIGLQGVAELVGCFDTDFEKSLKLASDFSIIQYKSLDEIFSDNSIDFVIVATTHNVLSDIATKSLQNSKHVFIEKPGSLTSQSLCLVAKLAREKKLLAHVGYNHRYHPAISEAISLAIAGKLGPIMFIRARYGHGGRLGYENEWRFQEEISGGGELIDQGTHLIDIALAILGDSEVAYAFTPTYFWRAQVEDNAFMSLRNRSGGVAFLHASCTEWKNTFSLEIYGKNAKAEVNGLGRSYGNETLTIYRMKEEMGPPDVEKISYQQEDISWSTELMDFVNDIKFGTRSSDNLDFGIRVLEIVEEIYARNKK